MRPMTQGLCVCVLCAVFMARAKRERVVQDGVEKVNRRPTDTTRPTDTAPLTPYLKINNF